MEIEINWLYPKGSSFVQAHRSVGACYAADVTSMRMPIEPEPHMYAFEDYFPFQIADKEKELITKSDLTEVRKVKLAEALALAKELNLKYIETSALTGSNIEYAFYDMAEQVIKLGMNQQ